MCLTPIFDLFIFCYKNKVESASLGFLSMYIKGISSPGLNLLWK